MLLPYMAGLFAGRFSPALLSPVWLLGGAFLASLVAIIFSKRPAVWTIGLCLALMLTGAAYYELRRARLPIWDNLPPREARLTLRIERTFSPSTGGKAFNGIGRITKTDIHLQELIGQRLYFSLARRVGDEPIRSAEIAVIGVLQALPCSAAADTFDGYLTGQGLNFRLTRGRLLEVSRAPTAYRLFCERAVNKMSALLGEGVAAKRPGLTAILRAMMLGQKQELSEEQDALFMHSGTMHLLRCI